MVNRAMMNKVAAVGLAGAMALAVASPSFARSGHAGSSYGFAHGAYAYQPGYGLDAYAYNPGPAYGYRGDYIVGQEVNSGATVTRSELGPFCSISMRNRDVC